MLTLLVGALSAAGACTRYALDRLVQARYGGRFPLGTLVVNVTGSFLFALVAGLGERHGLDPAAVLLVTAGFCSGYTTWSTWVWESVALVDEGRVGRAGLNVVGSLAAGLAAAVAGYALAAV